MAFINPYILVNKGGIPRLEAINTPTVDSSNNLTYDFNPHRFLNYPYAGLLIFKLPAVTAATTAGVVYFTSGGQNPTQLYNKAGTAIGSNNSTLAAGGIFIGWYSDNKLMLLNV